MTELWLPAVTPPQISEEAHELVIAEVLEKGLIDTSRRAQASLSLEDQALSNYIDKLGHEMSFASPDIPWHKNVLRLGAGLAWRAYRETGYYQAIDEHFATGEILAELDGIPEAYLTSLECDLKLISLIDHSIEDGVEAVLQRVDIKQVLGIGAGCVRFYLQQAVVAA